jgi:glyoxalase family protein
VQLTGIHHVTAVSADAPGNHAFYTGVLGMRLVKKTVNQDDVTAYHLFYADKHGSPGTDLTFFDWPAPPERRGGRTVTLTGLRVAGEGVLDWWRERLATAGVSVAEPTTRDGRDVLDFTDPEGQRLALVDDGGIGPAHPWEQSPVPAERQIRGLGPITLTVPELAPTAAVLTGVMAMRALRDYADPVSPNHRVHVFEMGEGGPAAELHVAVRPDLGVARPGAGGVHHIAFRAPDDREHRAWVKRLASFGVPNSGVVDRFYFRSLYFREPGGILFEIATDGPGFSADEPAETMGTKLALPPAFEPHRRDIEAGLKPL